ncbi:MAG: ATP-binding cassette domain-containing protein, partial [Bdellovibrionales bacterium]|nr:ATP-binding cassette domain-containing protein [Bdellovibrionales bacterium]
MWESQLGMIQVQNLTKAFHPDQPPAVNQVTFTLNKGEVGCLIGTSGSGKTTTLKMINRLIEPTAGKIWVNGSCHSNSKAIAWRRGIGYVVQKAGLLPHLTVSENISLLPDILKRDRKSTQTKVEELLEMVNLPLSEYGARYPAELSGGQQQRVGIARALVEDPPV